MLSSSLSRLALGASVPRMAPALISTSSNLNLAPALNPIIVTQMCALHTTEVVERARQSTRARKKKINDANKKKKEERLRKNPPPIPKKVIPQTMLSLVRSPPQIEFQVQLMLISKGLGKEPRPWRKPDNKPFPVDDVWAERLLNSS